MALAAATPPADGCNRRGGSQHLAAPDPGRRPGAAAPQAAAPVEAQAQTQTPIKSSQENGASQACVMTAASPHQEAMDALVAVVAQLRDPQGGCPWDLQQTHASLVPYVLEEAHEVADAIRHGDDAHLAEELGDLLLQVVLHA